MGSPLVSSSSTFSFTVDIKDEGLRLDKFLVEHVHALSRTRLQELIKDGFVCVDSQPLKDASLRIKERQVIEVIIPPLVEAVPAPQNISLEIIYEDSEVIVINKPPGMVVHPAPGNREGTLVNALLSHCGESLSGIGGVIRPGIVHRLDKETSGLLVAAKNDRAHQSLAHQLVTREMGRTYQAVVWGMIIPSEGEIVGAIGRDPHHRQRMAVREGGKFARTHYKVLKIYGRIASFLECRLETGRTHQIRVHLAAKGHSLIGDVLYGKAPRTLPSFLNNHLKNKWPPHRHALHAKRLSFTHPLTHEKLHFSIDLPEDIRTLLDMLNLHSS